MKVTVIGSGSIFFTRQMVKGMASSPVLRDAELALVDIDPFRCEQMGRFCQKLNDAWKGNLRIGYTTDRRAALPDSDFVVFTFSRNNYHPRGTGVQICRGYGVREASGDTAGPGGVFRILKTVPEVLEVARDVEQDCPRARVLNVVNPTNVVATALHRYTKLESLSFCDGMYPPSFVPRLCRPAGIEPTAENAERLDWKIGGLNHFTWLVALRFDGKDVWPRFKEGLKKEALAKGTGDRHYAEWQLCEIFDAYPTVVGHALEYVPYFQGRGSLPQNDYVVPLWDLTERIRWWRDVWENIVAINEGRLSPRQMIQDTSTDMIAQVIESIEGDLGRRFSVNVPNEGRIDGLPRESIVELWGRFHRDRIDIGSFGEFPRGLRGMTLRVMDLQEMALEAAMTGNYNLVVRAVAADPLVMSLSDAKRIAYEFMGSDHEHLPSVWNGWWKGLSGA